MSQLQTSRGTKPPQAGAVLALLLATATFPVLAANPGDEVIIVYNTRMPESRDVAAHYAEKRGVPANHMFGFALPANENMTRAEFQDSLQKPLAVELEKRKLWHIAVQNVSATTNQPFRAGPGVDSELALLPLAQQKLPLAGPLRNPLFTATNLALFHPAHGVLMVTRLDGPSPSIARGLVDKSIQAERDGLWGRTYFDLRNTQEPTYKAGDDMIRNASEICRRIGFQAVLDENVGTFPVGFPMSHIAFYAGWYTEHVSGPFTLPTVEFMPGAFAYHLHSYSANTLRSTDHHWVGPLLAKGVTATMGTIDEPYLSGTPDMAVFTARFLLSGFSFGEAAYACQPVLSWQTTVVGDPLYRPFGRNLDEVAKELSQRKSKLAEWCYLRLVDLNQANGRPLANLVSLLDQALLTTNSAVLMEKLAELYDAQGKPSSAVHAWEQALKLDPSPQQRLRLRLTLGERLLALSRDTEAYENYQKLLSECPDFADKSTIYKKLLPLAQKLNKKADTERYEAELKK